MDTHTIELLLDFTGIQVNKVALEKQRILIDCESKFEEVICPQCLKNRTADAVQKSQVNYGA